MTDRTELWIAQQMQHLMQEKPLSRIRTTEICERAEIERSTFYYHFKDKYDCAAWMFQHSVRWMDSADLREAAEDLQRMKNDMLAYRDLLSRQEWNTVWQYLTEYGTERCERFIEQRLPEEPDVQMKFTVRLSCYGAAGIIREWILGDSAVPAGILVRMIYRSLPEQLRAVYKP